MYTAPMTLVFGPTDAFWTIRIEDPQFTDGYALVTGGLTSVVDLDAGLASDIINNYRDAWASAMWTSSVITEVQVFNATTAATLTENYPGTGTAPNNMAVNSALLLEKSAAGRGRRFRGRNFLPSLLSEGFVFGDGTLDPGFLSDMQGRASDFFLDFVGGGSVPAIPQGEQKPKKDGSPGSAPNLPWPAIVNVGVDAKIATQRRRLRR